MKKISQEKTIDAKIVIINNDCSSRYVESNGFNLTFNNNKVYYRKDGPDSWHLVADNLPFDQWNHYRLVLTSGRIEIYINDVLEYTEDGTFAAKSYLGFRDHGLCVGAVTNYIDNVTVTPRYGEYDFTGKKISEGTGLVYFGGRWYDPEVGRFLTVDPIKNGLNWYVYCDNNPINYIDPLGLETTKTEEIEDNGDGTRTVTETITNENGTLEVIKSQTEWHFLCFSGWKTENTFITGMDTNGNQQFTMDRSGAITLNNERGINNGDLLLSACKEYLYNNPSAVWTDLVTGNWDFLSLHPSATFNINGINFSSEQFGNIVYGYTGHQIGYDFSVLIGGSVSYNLFQRYKGPLGWLPTGDVHDWPDISMGYNLYRDFF